MPYSVHLKKTQLGRNVVYEFYQHLFGNPETITRLIITAHPYVSTSECDAVARPIPLQKKYN